jgi:ABC-type multidrug transport system fused ATPase/permease subunit
VSASADASAAVPRAAPAPAAPREARVLPALLTGRRRWYFAGLVLAGLAHALAAGATVLVLGRGLAAQTSGGRVLAIAALVGIAGAVGWTRARERLLAERLGQDYVHEIRLLLVRRMLDGHGGGSLGATLTRASNDLNAVRNWVALGVAPIVAGVPLLLGCAAVLGALHPVLAGAVLVPLAMLGLVLWVASRQAYEQARRVRRERGRLAGHLADTLTATTAIRSAGGGYRELRRIDQRSVRVVQAAVDRARVAGRIRGAATAATGLATAAIIAGSMFAGLGGARLAAALTVVGLLSAPVQDLGRVVEYRQTFRAAVRVLAPALARPPRASGAGPTGPSGAATPAPAAVSGAAYYGEAGLVVSGLRLGEPPDAEELPPLYARAGDRVVVEAGDRTRGSAALDLLGGVRRPEPGAVRVAGVDLAAAGSKQRRVLLGYAAQGMRLERGSIARAVRYRQPDSEPQAVGDLLTRVGLAGRVAGLPGGEEARLRAGGEPLTPPDRARLLLARALLGEPPLLVLDHLDTDLGEQGRSLLRDLLDDYPGIVVLASDTPETVMTPTRRWKVG